MSFEADLKAHLQGLATIAGDDFFFDTANQKATPPFAVLTEAPGGQVVEHLTGAAGLAESAWHVYAYGPTREKANELGEEIRAGLHRFSGVMGSTFVDNVTLENYRDSGYDASQDKSYAPRYWTRFVYTIWHSIAEI